jgi:hypothetical protein
MNDEPCRDETRFCICVELFHAVGRCSGCIDFGIVHYGNLLDANCDGGLCIPGPEVSELM